MADWQSRPLDPIGIGNLSMLIMLIMLIMLVPWVYRTNGVSGVGFSRFQRPASGH